MDYGKQIGIYESKIGDEKKIQLETQEMQKTNIEIKQRLSRQINLYTRDFSNYCTLESCEECIKSQCQFMCQITS